MNENCPTHFQKAYILVLVSLLEVLSKDKSDSAWENALVKDVIHILARLLKWASGDVLRTALLLASPMLKFFPSLSTSFVRGLLELGDDTRAEFFYSPADKRSKNVIYWDLPFLLNSNKSFSNDAQWSLNILMGICKISESNLPLDHAHLLLIKAVTNHLPEKDDYKNVDQSVWDRAFLALSGPILSCLTINDLSGTQLIIF